METMDISALIPQLHRPGARIITGGQPAADAWPSLAKAGVTRVVNLRGDSELPGRNEAQEVRAAGMAYVHLPIDGPAGLGRPQADALWRALQAGDGTVLVHCGTGNRCGALLALAQAWHGGQDVESAIEFGRKAGLAGAEPVVRKLLS
jgi:uncharacterized protein (TIGR01244 family)